MLTVSLEARPVGSGLSSDGARGQVLGTLRAGSGVRSLQHVCDHAPRAKVPPPFLKII